jgi:hypothetical protein
VQDVAHFFGTSSVKIWLKLAWELEADAACKQPIATQEEWLSVPYVLPHFCFWLSQIRGLTPICFSIPRFSYWVLWVESLQAICSFIVLAFTISHIYACLFIGSGQRTEACHQCRWQLKKDLAVFHDWLILFFFKFIFTTKSGFFFFQFSVIYQTSGDFFLRIRNSNQIYSKNNVKKNTKFSKNKTLVQIT